MKVTLGAHAQIREVMSGSSYYSQSDLRLHFGLGTGRGGGRRRGRLALRPEGDVSRTCPPTTSSSIQETKGIVDQRRLG